MRALRRNVTNSNRGFTLVELLVVIAIIGVLVALLLPAIQAAREAARRAQCANNMKQLGLAVQLHHDAKRAYPPGRNATDTKSVSWAYYSLPYLEQQAIYQAYQPTFDVFAPENALTFRTPVPTFFCPSRRGPAADRDFDNNDGPTTMPVAAAGGDYAANAGDDFDPVDGGVIEDHEAGPIFTRSKINERQVTDGLSNTIAVGEKWITDQVASDEDNPPAPGAEANYHGDSAIFAGDSERTVMRISDHGFPGNIPDDDDNTRFGSEHTEQCHFAFLDGSVRLIPYTIDRIALEYLCVMADGHETPATF
jgi:prepilin-type N-terminal cleavage/methylation domain-containing protein/prepilin-type processing-associated H-X9-DG protein